jgi:hypothetical protein
MQENGLIRERSFVVSQKNESTIFDIFLKIWYNTR